MRTRLAASLLATSVLAASSLAASLLAAPAALADTTAAGPPTLSVSGAGVVFVTPDVATLTISVSRTASTSPAALSAANRRVRVVERALHSLGVTGSAIQTLSVDVSAGSVLVPGPHRRRRRVRSFTATEQLSARITRLAEVGPAIDALSRAGADSVDGPSFTFSDPSAGRIAAVRAALADARRRADDAAAATGYKVTGVQSVDIDPQSAPVPTSTSGAAGAPSAAPAPKTPTQVNPGTQEVDASVRVVYTIAPA